VALLNAPIASGATTADTPVKKSTTYVQVRQGNVCAAGDWKYSRQREEVNDRK
jgi:hypothetical protein